MTGKELKIKRITIDLTQGQLAKELGLNSNTISRYENDDLPIPKTVTLAMEALERRYEDSLNNVIDYTSGIDSKIYQKPTDEEKKTEELTLEEQVEYNRKYAEKIKRKRNHNPHMDTDPIPNSKDILKRNPQKLPYKI